MTDYLLTAPVVLLLATSVLLLVLHRVLPVLVSTWLALVSVVAAFLLACVLFVPLRDGPVASLLYQWSPVKDFGVPLVLKADGLSYLLLLLSLFVSMLVLIFDVARQMDRRREHVLALSVVSVSSAGEIVPSTEDTPASEKSRPGLEATPSERLSVGWEVLLLAALSLLLLANDSPMVYFSWTFVGVAAFGLKLSQAITDGDYESVRQFAIIDLLAGLSLLGGIILAWRVSGGDFLTPSTVLGAHGTFILALWALPALVRGLQYPFSRMVVLGDHNRASVGVLFQTLVFLVSGSYLLLRILASVSGPGAQLRSVALALSVATVLYGLVSLMREVSFDRLRSWTTVIGLGLSFACFTVGGFSATLAGLMILVSHLVSVVVLGMCQEAGDTARDAAPELDDVAHNGADDFQRPLGNRFPMLLTVVSLAGLPVSLGFWGYWMMTVAGLNSGQPLLFILPVATLPFLMWKVLWSFDIQLSQPIGFGRDGKWTRSCLWLSSAVLVVATILVGPLVRYLIEPAVRETGVFDNRLFSLAVFGNNDWLAGWLSVVGLLVLLAMVWLVWRADPLPQFRSRLGIGINSFLGPAGQRRYAIASIVIELLAVAPIVRWLNQPGLLAMALWLRASRFGQGLGAIVEGAEERYFAPSIVFVAVVVLLIFFG